MSVGVLVMAYGGPASLDEIPGYLADIRHGRPTPRAVLDEITENYRTIGGSSPLLDVTRRQVDALAAELGDGYRCYLGMRHWAPWIEDVVGQMIEDGVEHAVSLVLAPHFSALSVARYQQKVADGLDLYRGRIQFEHVPSYHDAPGLVTAFASRVDEGLARWADGERQRVHVVFSAHSLPQRVLASGDPYADQCLETARLVAERAGLEQSRWSWAYQSAGRTPEPWAGPDIGEHLVALAAEGVRDVVSIPVGFVSDHVEILFDIDHRAAEVASSVGIRLERPPALNDDPVFIAALAELVRGRAAAVGLRRSGSMRAVVVGGGIAGLAAARRLESIVPDVEVTLVESDDTLGGKIRTEHVDGFVIETAADSFLARKERGLGLVEELGLEDELIGRRPEHHRTFIRRGNDLHPLPEGLTGLIPTNLDALERSDLLSPEGKERFALEPDVPPAAGDEDESVASFVSRRFGREAYDALVEPLMTGIYGGDGDQLSLRATFPQLRALELEHGSLLRGLPAPTPTDRPPFLSFRNGMGSLVAALVAGYERTEVLLGRAAVRIGRGAAYEIVLADGGTIGADGVVVATPAFVTAELLADLDPELASEHASIPYASSVVVTLAFSQADVAAAGRLRLPGPADHADRCPRVHVVVAEVGRARAGGLRADPRVRGTVRRA